MTKRITILIATLAVAFISQTTTAQDLQKVEKAMSLVKSNAAALGLSDENVLNSRVSDTYVDALTGNTLVYLQQTYKGIDVDKVVQVLAFKNGKVVSGTGKRIDLSLRNDRDASQRIKSVTPAITIDDAIHAAAQHLHLPTPSVSRRVAPANGDFSKKTDFGDMGIAKSRITARMLWLPQNTFERVKLTWEVNISPKKSSDSWRILVDAQTGNVIKKENYTIPDNWNSIKAKEEVLEKGKSAYNTTSSSIKDNDHDNDYSVYNSKNYRVTQDPKNSLPWKNLGIYRVIPFPQEAPSFTSKGSGLDINPWQLSPQGSGATPFNWNEDGLERYTNTRGNNVLAQEDLDGNDGVGRRAEGFPIGDNIIFNYKPDYSKLPTQFNNQGFAITNLFYWNNIMHDLSYQYGFNEVSGNFQQNNLQRGGLGNDFVYADAQDGGSLGNANFSTPPDGENPRMQMYLFPGDPAKGMTINSPLSIAGKVNAVEGGISPKNLLLNTGPVTGNVVLYNSASDTAHIACDAASNINTLKGNIALVVRGSCAFTDKVLNAQKAGAKAVIIMDNIPGEPLFPWGSVDTTIVIPAMLISYEDGIKIRTVLSTGTAVNVTLLPVYKDGDLDNGIIAHEYTHGISMRLTGGPSTTSCLFNAEQMGEGWSDYISLMTITDWRRAQANDGALAKGIGSYVLNQPVDGPGIRTYPYSTDMRINPHTYSDLSKSGEPHYVGEIWASVLWDMTWNIIQMDGINRDIFNSKGEGGNSIVYKLVMEGMKLQPCSPGFIDGRNAILKADTLLYNGKYSCVIWQTFARRGMGLGASQGNTNITGDEIPDYNLGAISITKHVNKDSVESGDSLTYLIGLKAKTICNGDVPQNYLVADSLPGNLTYVGSDGVYNAASRTVRFDNINMKNGDSITFRIKVKVNDKSFFPDTVYLNDSINDPVISDKWIPQNGNNLAWTILDASPYFYYYTNDNSTKDEEKLVTRQAYLVPGTKTTFSFFHNFAADDFNNGGVVEITSDSGQTWLDLGPYMDATGVVYTETITGNSTLSGRRAFSGYGIGTTTIDLSAFAGKKVKIRFRYATSDNSFAVPNGGTGWIIDDIVLSASAYAINAAKLIDSANKTKGSSTVTTKIIIGENVPPVVRIISPVDDTTYASPATIRLIAKAKDPNDRISKVEFYNGTSLLRTEYIYPYTYIWKNVQPGTYTITAKAYDVKGLSATSTPVKVTVSGSIVSSRPIYQKDKTDKIGVTLNPNPASTILNIYTNGLEIGKTSNILVMSATGVVLRKIQSNRLDGVVQIDVSSLVKGVYTVEIISGEKVLYKQFVKL
ncbi:M36 family metallopeptidase [Segetibacter koreensis]|uniref:M36 family metallopeptidase n=1 Tax=Segetibacter koreensis TaxID=398037 RepID=UPI00036B7CFF|nr:M36 family metallopeptidase [Segetibacter koreensis]